MHARVYGLAVGVATAVAVATVSLAEDVGYRPGRGGIGGQFGPSKMTGEEDYSLGASFRFSFSGHWRYAITPWLRWQVSPGFAWAKYDDQSKAPFRDPNFPADSTKAQYLTLLAPVSAQLQVTRNRGSWLYYAGAGPGIYRVWIENHRKVVEDPVSRKLHRGVYPGVTVQLGVERFLKSLPSTSLEVSLDGHQVFAQRDEQFPAGFNSQLRNLAIRVGGNYYFVPSAAKKTDAGPPPTPKP